MTTLLVFLHWCYVIYVSPLDALMIFDLVACGSGFASFGREVGRGKAVGKNVGMEGSNVESNLWSKSWLWV